jgi:GNAT superfamily N-acetyltransferase
LIVPLWRAMQGRIGTIRQFRRTDAEACSSVVRACLLLDPLMQQPAGEALLQTESPAILCEWASRFYMAVCELENCLAGVGGVDMNEIRLLFVHPDHQRKGIGSGLLKHLEDLVPPALFSGIFVYAAPAAAGFYRMHGYQSGGEHVEHLGSITVPTIFMTKRFAG